MDSNLKIMLEKQLDNSFIEAVISNSTDKENFHKIKLRPIIIQDEFKVQATEYRKNKVFHNNLSKEELIKALENWFEGEIRFHQMQITSKESVTTVLISKKGKVTIKSKKTETRQQNLEHNRKKKYILQEGTKIPFLIDLGVMTEDGKIINAKYDKFKQMNRYLEFIEDILPNLDKKRELTIIDFGCGKSYLTFAMYYFFNVLKQYNIRIIGLDLKDEVINSCNQLSKRYGYNKLTFLHGDIASFEGVTQVDMVVTLHACDTATDFALYKAVKWNSKVILSVPCCQHELNKQMNCKELSAIYKYGLIKERDAALLTDAIRANLLEEQGYRTQILEFIDMEHTPKNILIRAVKTNRCNPFTDYEKLKEFYGINPTLGQLLKGK